MYFNVVSFIVTKKMKYIELVKVIFKLVNCTSFYFVLKGEKKGIWHDLQRYVYRLINNVSILLYRKFLSNKHEVHQTISRLDQYSVWIIYYHWLYVPVFPSYILKAVLLFSYFAAHFIRAIDITRRDLRTNLSSQVNLTEFMLYIIVVPFLTSDYISSLFYFQIGCLSIY